KSRISNFITSGNANDTPLLARPFFNAFAEQEDAQTIAIPGLEGGVSSTNYLSRVMGAEVNVDYQTLRAWRGTEFLIFGGVRYLSLQEKLLMADVIRELPGSDGTLGDITTLADNFTTYNQIFGAQIGSKLSYRWEKVGVDVIGKFAAGPNYQKS